MMECIDEMVTTRKYNPMGTDVYRACDETLLALATELGAPDIIHNVKQWIVKGAAATGTSYLQIIRKYVTKEPDCLAIDDLNKLSVVTRRLEEFESRVTKREDIDLQNIQKALDDAINLIQENPNSVSDLYGMIRDIGEMKIDNYKMQSRCGNMISYDILSESVN